MRQGIEYPLKNLGGLNASQTPQERPPLDSSFNPRAARRGPGGNPGKPVPRRCMKAAGSGTPLEGCAGSLSLGVCLAANVRLP
ncbi:MAG: hypothetical protein LBB80_05490 [Treponema sp.]|nr:hypothetical protein [Treponema sp.]